MSEDLENRILSWDNIWLAYRRARARHGFSREVLTFERDLVGNIIRIHDALADRSWRPHEFRTFIIHEPKERLIAAPCFEDRIVQLMWANVCEPIIDQKFIDTSYACRIGKGAARAHLDLQTSLKTNLTDSIPWYVGRIDYRKYFHTIPHPTLHKVIRRHIQDEFALWVIDIIIDSYPIGLPIGSVTSQILANVVLDVVDHFATETLGIRRYFRYMDDILYIGNNRKMMEDDLTRIANFSQNELGINVNGNKCKIINFKKPGKVADAIDFCGALVTRDGTKIRHATIHRSTARIIRVHDCQLKSPTEKRQVYLKSLGVSLYGLLKHKNLDGYAVSRIQSMPYPDLKNVYIPEELKTAILKVVA